MYGSGVPRLTAAVEFDRRDRSQVILAVRQSAPPEYAKATTERAVLKVRWEILNRIICVGSMSFNTQSTTKSRSCER